MFARIFHIFTTPPPLKRLQKNLERAHLALFNRDMTKAAQWNTEAAKAARELLVESKRLEQFPSRLAAAGIALLRDGDSTTASPLLDNAWPGQPHLAIAQVWAGLAHAHLGRLEQALECWEAFQGVAVNRVPLGNDVHAIAHKLRLGEMSLAQTCEEIAKALTRQERLDVREGRKHWLLSQL